MERENKPCTDPLLPSQSHHHLLLDYRKSLVTSTLPSTFFLTSIPHSKQHEPPKRKKKTNQMCHSPAYCPRVTSQALGIKCIPWPDSRLMLSRLGMVWPYLPICLFHLLLNPLPRSLTSAFWSHIPSLCYSKIHSSIHLQTLAPAAPSAPRSSLGSLFLINGSS